MSPPSPAEGSGDRRGSKLRGKPEFVFFKDQDAGLADGTCHLLDDIQFLRFLPASHSQATAGAFCGQESDSLFSS
jgi:hypothetical protein